MKVNGNRGFQLKKMTKKYCKISPHDISDLLGHSLILWKRSVRAFCKILTLRGSILAHTYEEGLCRTCTIDEYHSCHGYKFNDKKGIFCVKLCQQKIMKLCQQEIDSNIQNSVINFLECIMIITII